MTLLDRAPAAAVTRRRPKRGILLSLAVAVAASVTLLIAGPNARTTPSPAGRVAAADAWPRAQRADFDPALPDGPLFTPLLFLDATTALGTAPTPDARWVRVLLWHRGAGAINNARANTGGGADTGGGANSNDDTLRELRRLPLESNPQFEAATADGDDLVWTESTDSRRMRIWHAKRGGGAATLVTADTGDALFYGNSFDVVIADGRVHWAAAPKATDREGGVPQDPKLTDIRSAPVGGGNVDIRTEPGEWAMSAWPWLVDEREGRLRNLETGRDVDVVTSGPEIATCSPVWCRVMVMSGDGLARIDLMHPDGSQRRRMAGGGAQTTATGAQARVAGAQAGAQTAMAGAQAGAQAAVADVAVLDRFELLAETGPDSDVTGTATLLAYDAATGRTVVVAPDVDGAFTGAGMLWWSTGGDDSITWHALDLRTV